MKKINRALSNEVYLKKNIIIKKYTNDEFQKSFGNQERKILSKLNYKNKVISNNEISIEYFSHIPFDDKKINDNDILSVIEALNALHNLDINGINKSGFMNVAKKIFNIKDEFEKKLYENAERILNKEPQVVLHNDVVEGNLLKIDSKIKLIDFEYSGIGNPIFDLASFFTERVLTNKQKELAIKSYSFPIDKKELHIVSMFLQNFWMKWADYKFKTTNKSIYKKIFLFKEKEYLMLKELNLLLEKE